MGDLSLDTQGAPTAPSSTVGVVYFDSVSKLLTSRNNLIPQTVGGVRNANTADVVATGADTYLTGSALAIPSHLMQVGATFNWRFVMTKSGAGVAPPVWIVRVGTAGTTADSARLTFTQVAAQTGVVDTGFVDIIAVLRNTGASGVLAGGLAMTHVLAITGFSTLGANVMQVTSAGFDTTVAATIVGVSVNPGASGVWTHQVVTGELVAS